MITPIPPTMKAVRLHGDGLDDLAYEEVPTPVAAPGEVVVRVHAAAITRDELEWPADRLPAIPSYEVSGTVSVLGDGVTRFEPGRPVYGLSPFDRDGVAAEYVALPAGLLAAKPERLGHAESAALPLPGLSAMQGLLVHGRLERNDRVVVHGAGGGVGAYAVQLARLHGAYVIATASGERAATARMLGADQVVDRGMDELSGIEPVDLVFDTGGGDRLAVSADLVRPGGRLVSVAEEPPYEACAARGITGVYFVVEPDRSGLAELTRLADQGLLQVQVDRTYPLADARKAFERSLDRRGRGKVVLWVVD